MEYLLDEDKVILMLIEEMVYDVQNKLAVCTSFAKALMNKVSLFKNSIYDNTRSIDKNTLFKGIFCCTIELLIIRVVGKESTK
jgi:hypothetical protein